MRSALFKSSIAFTLLTFVSRIFGFVRDFVIARAFGAGIITDTFFVAFRIPNFFRRLFAEGAFSQAFVPLLSEARAKGDAKAEQALIDHIGSFLLLALLGVTAFGVLFAPAVVFVFAWDFYFAEDKAQFKLAVEMLRITFPYLLFISLCAVASGILNVYERFWVSAFTPVLLNLSIILSAIYFSSLFEEPIVALAWGVFLGGILQLLFQIPFLLRLGKFPSFRVGKHSSLWRFRRRILPTLFGASIAQINLLIDTMIATTLVAGSVSWLYYSDRILEFPLALIGVAISTVALAKLSHFFAKKKEQEFWDTTHQALNIAVVLVIPSTVGIFILGESLLVALFQYEAFTGDSTQQAKLSLFAYGAGLAAFVIGKILLSVFFARGDAKTPLKTGVAALVVNLVLNILLAHFFVHTGIAAATSIAALVNACLLLWFLWRDMGYTLSAKFFHLSGKSIVASLIMGLVLSYTANADALLTLGLSARLVVLGGQVIVGILVYFTFLFVMGVRVRDL